MSSSEPGSPSGSILSPTPPATPSPPATCEKGAQTSPIARPASKKPKLEDNIEVVGIFLKCGSCLEFPSSPIYSCANVGAHVLCGRCAPNFIACPTCQYPKLSPSPVAEKLANEAQKKIKCANFEAGCKEGVLSTKFVDHLPLCFFRDIRCYYDNNCGLLTRFQDYPAHLEIVHHKVTAAGPKLKKSYEWDENFYCGRNDSALKFGSHHFIVREIFNAESKKFAAWVCVLGDSSLGEKYFCEVEFNTSDPEPYCSQSWRLPVVGFHDSPEHQLIDNPAVAVGKVGQDDNSITVTYEIKAV